MGSTDAENGCLLYDLEKWADELQKLQSVYGNIKIIISEHELSVCDLQKRIMHGIITLVLFLIPAFCFDSEGEPGQRVSHSNMSGR